MKSDSVIGSVAATAAELAGPRFVPAIGTAGIRFGLGLLSAAAGPVGVAALRVEAAPAGGPLLLAIGLAWLPAVSITDKFRHKYPYRYRAYLVASHLKAVVVLATLLVLLHWGLRGSFGGFGSIDAGLGLAFLADFVIALPRREERRAHRHAAPVRPAIGANVPSLPPPDVDRAYAIEAIAASLDEPMRRFLGEALPDASGGERSAFSIEDREELKGRADAGTMVLLVGRRQLNAVRRLNLLLQDCAAVVTMGGFLAIRYVPLDANLAALRRRFPGALFGPAYLLHFLWYRAIPKLPWLDVLYFSSPFRVLDRLFYRPRRGRRRVLSRSEVWGRLAYFGFEVMRETPTGGECLVLARKVSTPVANRRPSYYAVVALEKVGLDGDVIRLYKVRSMFPFSEFLQKKIFESHGLSATGKFKNDFRLTEYGPLIRRSWLDELPGLFNWIRGDLKLVGMRATSPHFLGLYPPSVYDRYIHVKPGLVPPIFDEKTTGFEQIVEIEETYLRRYLDSPVRTDITYFWYTFRDIVFRRVRSH